MWNPDEYLQQLYKQTPSLTFTAGSHAEWQQWRAALQQTLIDSLVLPDKGLSGLEPVAVNSKDCGDYVREQVQLTTAPHMHMPAYVLVPKRPLRSPGPAVLACPGHGYGYKELVGLLPDGSERPGGPGIYKDYPVELAKRGLL
ncbi:alpha/beta hydrolase family protein [Paenibacillus thalictri]|uniref:alpha/beta hydrolase family protein n=1 Tax=Paenibacillus thalictri TaxID=2527873 RepID=UPI001F0DF470|nr:alpha/beta hydrolase family protein [Paenibacillus thalictri]